MMFLIFFIFQIVRNAQNVTWLAHNYMQSNVIQAITSNSISPPVNTSTSFPTKSYGYQVNFLTSFTQKPHVSIGILGLQIPQLVKQAIYLSNEFQAPNFSGFSYILVVNSSNKITNLKVNYLAIDQSKIPLLKLRQLANPLDQSRLIDTSTSSSYQQISVLIEYAGPQNMSHVLVYMAFIKSFSVSAVSSDFSVGVRFQGLNDTFGKAIFWKSGKSLLFYVDYYNIRIDKTELEKTKQYFVDYGNIKGNTNTQITKATILTLVNNGYIFGANYFNLNMTSTSSQGFQLEPTNYSLTSQNSYSYVNISYFNFRIRSCPNNATYYYQKQQLCYDQCPVQSYPNTTYKYCYQCDTPCYTCPDASKCSSCNESTSFRTLVGSTCVCMPGYFQNNQYVCGSCIQGCSKCNNNLSCNTCNAASGYFLNNSKCVCNSSSFSQNNVCKLCSSVLFGCKECSNNTYCNSCINTNYTYDPVQSLCKCQIGYTIVLIIPNLICQSCVQLMDGCRQCDSANICRICSSQFVLDSSVCKCPAGTYFHKTSVATCLKCDTSCLTCIGATNLSCTSCASFMVHDQQSLTCTCPQTGQVSDGSSCVSCQKLCSSLFCTAKSDSSCTACQCPCQNGYYLSQITSKCQECDYQDLISRSTSCTCPIGMYESSNLCQSCDYSCLTCSFSSNKNCTRCSESDFRTLKNGSCPCNAFYMDANNSTSLCITLECTLGYIISASGYCITVCGDGLVPQQEQCDDNNTISGDGCSLSCKIQQNYTCVGNLTHSSVCSFNKPLDLKLVSIVKNPQSNNLTYVINIKPNISALNTLNFSELIDLGLPPDSIVTYKYEQGVLVAEVQYFHDLQSIPSQITFNPSGSQSTTFSLTPNTILDYSVQPTNNLAANVYSDDIYRNTNLLKMLCIGLVGLTFLVYALGIFSGKLIGTQMMWVVQLGFIGLLILDFSDPLYQPIRNLALTHGFSIKFSNVQTDIPYNISSLGYYNSLINNFNLIMGLDVLVAIISFSLFISSKIVKDEALKTKLLGYSKIAIGEYLLMVILFSVYQYGVSVCILAKYPFQKGLLLYASIAEATIFGGVFVAIVLLFGLKSSQMFGEYKTFFNKTTVSQYYYFIPIACRVGIACSLGIMSQSNIGGYIVLGILSIQLILTIAIRPYLLKKHTVRQSVNLLAAIIVISIYVFLGKRKQQKVHQMVYYVPFIIVGLLVGIVLMNMAFLVYQIVKICKKKNDPIQSGIIHQQSLKEGRDENGLDMFEQESKKFVIKKTNHLFGKKIKSQVSKSSLKNILSPNALDSLLSPEGITSSKMQQFQNDLFPLGQKQQINIDDIELKPFSGNKSNDLSKISEEGFEEINDEGRSDSASSGQQNSVNSGRGLIQ